MKNKSDKNKKKKSKKKVVVQILIFMALFLMMSIVSARVGFTTNKANLGNGSLEMDITLAYNSESSLRTFDDFIYGANGSLNFVPVGQVYEIPLTYVSNIKSWNENNPSNKVISCFFALVKNNINNVSIYSVINGSYNPFSHGFLLRENFTSESDETNTYFFKLNDGDFFTALFLCQFENNYTGLSMPVEFSVNQPTFNCKACQYSQWSTNENSRKTANYVNTKKNIIIGYIQSLVSMNFEIFIYIFWIVMIGLAFFVFGILFWLFYWIYKFIEKTVK